MKVMLIGLLLLVPFTLGMASCGGFTQADIDRAVVVAGDSAFRKVKAETMERLVKTFTAMGISAEEAAKLAAVEADRLAEAAKRAAEDLTKKAMGPPKTEGGGLLGVLATGLLNVGLAYAEAKSRSW